MFSPVQIFTTYFCMIQLNIIPYFNNISSLQNGLFPWGSSILFFKLGP
jgi:hypothetical protein